MKDFASYYDSQFSESAEIYEPFTVLLKAAHEARMNILDRLQLGDLKNKVVVDFGTGSWGFACVFPKLHECGLAIGIDISAQAVAISEEKSRTGQFSYGNRYKYLVSDGITIPLEDNSADVFFTGECIEHVENTDAFLDEIYRVLKPEGILILTTPNPRPWFYRAFDLEYAVGPEHIALMEYDELESYLAPRFDVLTWQGYNSTVHPDIDDKLNNSDWANTWAQASVNNPRDACGFVVSAQSRLGYTPSSYKKTSYRLTSEAVRYSGNWEELIIHKDLTAHMTQSGGQLSLDFQGNQLIVLLWTHDWSGFAEVTLDGTTRQVDLYARFAGFKRLVFRELSTTTKHTLTIKATGEKRPLSHSDQVIFFTASSFEAIQAG